jgi:isopenicillin-N epimerase
MIRQADILLEDDHTNLADYIGCDADEVVFTTNPTTAVNIVVRSLDLQPGDEILTTDHEYGAKDRTWQFISKKTGAIYRQQPMPLPLTTPEEFVEAFWAAVTP